MSKEDSLFGLDTDPGREISRDTVAAVMVEALAQVRRACCLHNESLNGLNGLNAHDGCVRVAWVPACCRRWRR